MIGLTTIGDLVEFRKGKKPPELLDRPTNGARRFLQIDDLRGESEPKFAHDPEGTEVSEADICIVWDGAKAGTVGYGLRGLIGSTIARMRLREPDKVHAPYVGRFLQSRFEILNQGTQGAAIPHIDGNQLRTLELFLPPPSEQRRIAAILDKADAIHHKQRQVLGLADEFLRSVFLEMFGDLTRNRQNWDTRRFSHLMMDSPQNGLYRPSSDYGRGTPILRIDSFYDGYLVEDFEPKRVDIDHELVAKFLLCEDDIVINRVNSRKFLGKSALIEGLAEPTVFESNMMRMRVKEDEVAPRFVVDQLQTPFIKNQVQRLSRDAVNQSSINQEDVGSIQLRVPPVAMQEQYVRIVRAARKSKFTLRAQAAKSDAIFACLSQRAFRGEL